MKIDVTEDNIIRIRDAFVGVLFETDDGEKLGVCMRNGVNGSCKRVKSAVDSCFWDCRP